MSFDLNLFSKKILKCRENLQLSIKEVSYDIPMDIKRLQSLEDGVSIPTGDEVLIFADYYKHDYHFFINNESKTIIEQVNILYRKHGNHFSKSDRKAVQDFLYLCECEQFLCESTNFQKKHFNPSLLGNYFKEHGIQLAKQLRDAFGLDHINIVTDPYSLFRKLGIHIFRRKLENSSISGLFINHPKAGKCVLINYNEDIFRQNFTLAHEIAHALLDSNDEVNVSFEQDNTELKEVRANNFASNFFIPQEILIKYKNVEWSPEILTKIASQLGVNIQPLLIALKNVKIINNKTYFEFKGLKIPSNLKIDPELSNTSERRKTIKRQLLQKGLSDHYVRLCYTSYDNDLISSQRLAEMLLVKESELAIILETYNFYLKHEN